MIPSRFANPETENAVLHEILDLLTEEEAQALYIRKRNEFPEAGIFYREEVLRELRHLIAQKRGE